ncbi:MAG: SH3 domain-containing protein [Candidatus Onthomonas sp.]
MKKCPVCGVEHSDIVPVCSICGSSLANAEILPDPKAADAIAPEVAPIPAQAPEVKAEAPAPKPASDFSEEDIQAAVSSVVSFAVEHDKVRPNEPAEIDPFDDDSPFVENAMRERKEAKANASKAKAESNKKAAASGKQNGGQKSEKPPKSTAARRPTTKKPAEKGPEQPKSQSQPKPVDPVIDTTAVAAASAQKVQAAKDNAVAARQRNAQTEEENSNSFDWSERKHKRNQPKTTTPVIAAVCALLALLIIAMVFLLGKLVTGDGEDNNQPADNQPGVVDNENPDEADQQDQNTPEDENQPDQQEPEDSALPENNPDAEDQGDETDPDAAAQENQDEQDGQDGQDGQQPQENEDGQDSQQPETGDSTAEDERPALPEITEMNDTVYATAAVNVRDYPSTQSSTVINVLSKGQAVTRTGKTATGWSRVKIGDTVGYVSNSYLSTSKVDASAENDSEEENVAYATAGVNVRETPNGTVIGTLTENQKVTLTGKKDGNWIQIKTSSLTGYVYSSYLSSTKNGGSDQADDSKKDDVKLTETNDTVYATTGVNVRDYPNSSSGQVIATLTKGQEVTRIGKTSNGWSKIKTGSVTGYVYSDYLSASKSGGSSDSGDSGKRTGYILPDSATRNYTKEELSSLSSSQLRLARNEIYARHGRKFNDKSLQDYFNSCSWYSGTVDPATFDANINSYLNSYEIANLKLIKEVEG